MHNRTLRGFSTLELLVAISLSGIILGMSIPLLRSAFSVYHTVLSFTSEMGDLRHAESAIRQEINASPLYRGVSTRVVIDPERQFFEDDLYTAFLLNIFRARSNRYPPSPDTSILALIQIDTDLRFTAKKFNTTEARSDDLINRSICFDRSLGQLSTNSRMRLKKAASLKSLLIGNGETSIQEIRIVGELSESAEHQLCTVVALALLKNEPVSGLRSFGASLGGMVLSNISFIYVDDKGVLRIVKTDDSQNHPIANSIRNFVVQYSPETGRGIIILSRIRTGDARTAGPQEHTVTREIPVTFELPPRHRFESLDLLQ